MVHKESQSTDNDIVFTRVKVEILIVLSTLKQTKQGADSQVPAVWKDLTLQHGGRNRVETPEHLSS